MEKEICIVNAYNYLYWRLMSPPLGISADMTLPLSISAGNDPTSEYIGGYEPTSQYIGGYKPLERFPLEDNGGGRSNKHTQQQQLHPRNQLLDNLDINYILEINFKLIDKSTSS